MSSSVVMAMLLLPCYVSSSFSVASSSLTFQRPFSAQKQCFRAFSVRAMVSFRAEDFMKTNSNEIDLRSVEEQKIQAAGSIHKYTFLAFAFLPPIIAFGLYPEILNTLEDLIMFFRLAAPVDGGQLSVNLLTPPVNGVVVPTISIALGTLFATTVNVLRQRQVDIRSDLNGELCELRLLRRAIFGAFGTYRHRESRILALTLMRSYVQRLINESNSEAMENLDIMLKSCGIADNELDKLSAMLHGWAGASANRQNSVDACHSAISSLSRYRSTRLASLLSGFPNIHYIILSLLSLIVCLTFLQESNVKPLQFLEMPQLRSIFGLLVAVCSGTGALCYDLADPFVGSFSIITTSRQLFTIRDLLDADIEDAKLESLAVTVGSSAEHTDRWGQRAYAGRDALLFHVFTSRFADTARMCGDLVAVGAHMLGSAKRRVFTSARSVARRPRQLPPQDDKDAELE